MIFKPEKFKGKEKIPEGSQLWGKIYLQRNKDKMISNFFSETVPAKKRRK